MSGSELAALSRAHELFAGPTRHVTLDARAAQYDGLLKRAAGLNTGGGQELYRAAVDRSRVALRSATTTDAAVAATAAQAHRDHADARALTQSVLDEARADTATPDTPMAQREAVRRRAARLRAQRAHVMSARRSRPAGIGRRCAPCATESCDAAATGPACDCRRRTAAPGSRCARRCRGWAVRYVWGATGPDRFDCSGLTQWSDARAGIHLDRTTYQQIYDGIPIPHPKVRPGDLVFPSAGHVQMAIGNNLVVEAPHSGAAVRISPLGTGVQIRRPLG